jgi:hypothetical protein
MAKVEEVKGEEIKKEIKKSTENSYQMLMEGRAELLITPADDEVNQCNFSKLLRDLYIKIYDLEAKVAVLASPN